MGVEIISELVLKNGLDFPLIDSNNIRGGFYLVKTTAERNQIPLVRRKEGMICFVEQDHIYYRWTNGHWNRSVENVEGIPILNATMIKLLEESGSLPERYVAIPDDDDLDGFVYNKTYTTTNNGNYVDILFSALRSLLSEVAKLKNSFKYGINSYNGTHTAISTTYGSYKDPEDEPLWAVEESDLSELHECTLDMQALDPKDIPLEGDFTIDFDKKNIKFNRGRFVDPKDGFKVLTDPKSFVYLTTNSKQVQFEIVSDSLQTIDINTINTGVGKVDLYNILFILSKKTIKSELDSTLYGDNYIWISISDYYTDKVLALGYYDGTDTLKNNLSTIPDEYYIERVNFTNLILYKFNSYTKYQDFSSEVIPEYPNDDDYKFGVAHLTIRSILNEKILKEVSSQLLNNELIWVEETKKLFIKSKGSIHQIGSDNKDDNMTIEELIANLKNLGIVVDGKEGDYSLLLANLTGVTFIHLATGKKFNIEVDSEGKLRSTLENDDTLEKRLQGLELLSSDDRGFISKLRIAENNRDFGTSLDGTSDVGLLSDRVKIGAIYAPQPGRTIYGCSHAYVELENTSNRDVCLKGCYLHVAYQDGPDKTVKSLPLTGTLKAGSTYLIRGKQYANFEDKNTVIKVDNYDLEWYVNGKLIDFQRAGLHFLLVYDIPNVETTVNFVLKSPVPKAKSWKVNNNKLIDLACVRDSKITSWVTDVFLINDAGATRDYILRNTYELDPAKLAFLAICEKDSSRVRGTNKNDFKPLYIDVDKIKFPHSDEEYPVSLFKPRASFENRNISTDKSKLDYNKPNMVYCSFGINMNITRTFNWVSVGSFDEYVWVRKKTPGNTEPWKKFESYTKLDIRKDIPILGEGTVVEKIELDKSGIYRKEYYDTYKVTAEEVSNIVYVSDNSINNTVYARMQGRFPGDGSFYTAHKCILNFPAAVGMKVEYEYIVGREQIDGTPDMKHASNTMNFTLYPENIKPRIYQITDQLGFYWLEYLTWAGSAKAVLKKIEDDLAKESFIPVIINTGDMTQNGTRVNEWIDYYKAGECLFKKYEHMSVVGNNDLCNTDPAILGTGDDIGKSNGYYHHLFQCFEIDTPDLIIKGSDNQERYIPSTYYIECKVSPEKYERIVCIDSEITFVNCRDWFKLNTPNEDVAYNIYTGWTTGNTTVVEVPEYTKSFVPVYNILYRWLSEPNRRCITACHEMPFTVITRLNLSVSKSNPGYTTESRSVDGKVGGKLIGSHLNLITKSDHTAMYWFSRLLESKGVKLCIGGHKHTYTCTYPVREFYFYDDGKKNSLIDGPMQMGADLSDEYVNGKYKVTWKYTNKDNSLLVNDNGNFKVINPGDRVFNSFMKEQVEFNTSRTPIVKFSGQVYKVSSATSKTPYANSELDTLYLPMIGNSNMNDGVVYFMCQATGYKLTSNKELPGSAQAFTLLLPLTIYNSEKGKDDASAEQQLPMFAIVKYTEEDKFEVKLLRVINVQISKKHPLYNNPGDFSTEPIDVEYINCENPDYIKLRFGVWGKEESNVVVI